MEIQSSLNPDELARYTARQIENNFPDAKDAIFDQLMVALPNAQKRLEHCFSQIDNKYFFNGKQAVFNHLHGDQYAMWLYFLSNELFRQNGAQDICSKLFLLNKMLHGCDIFYEVSLPEIFLLVHPLGTVLGRGNYSNYFVAYQRCSIGSNHDSYPTLGKYLTMRPGSSVLGNCVVAEMCQIAAEALLIDQNLKSNSIFMGRPGRTRLIPNSSPYPLWRV